MVTHHLREGFMHAELLRDGAGVALDWRYLDVNPAWGRLVGKNHDEVIGRTLREVFAQVDDNWIGAVANVVGTGEPMRFNHHIAELGRWYDGEVVALGGDQFCVMFTEVTHRRQSDIRQWALLELSQRMRELNEPAAMAAGAAEIVGKALGLSTAGYGLFEDDQHTVVVESEWNVPGAFSVVGRHDLFEFGTYVEDLRRGDNFVVEDTETDPNGKFNVEAMRSINVRSAVNLPMIENGRLVAVFFLLSMTPRRWSQAEINFARDVTERTRSFIERVRAEQAFQTLAASLENEVVARTAERDRVWRLSNDVMLVADFTGKILATNPAWEKLLGWEESELIGENLLDLLHPDDLAGTLRAVEKLTAGEHITRFENRYRRKSGDYCWISWAAVPGDGKINAVGRDLTPEHEAAAVLRRTEEHLRQSQKMEAVGQLTGGLAHDFNNLLAGIMGSLELLEMRLKQGRTNEIDKYVLAAQNASRRAAALTHRLLAFSRRQTLDPRPTDIRHLIGGMSDLIRRTVGPSIAVEVVDTIGLWPAQVDGNQLENALLNLCINARDAMPGGGRLTIETANRWMDERMALECDLTAGQYLSICISDTGTGMTPEIVSRAFDPFFTTKPLGQGTGLGLSMIYGFASQSGGQARIYSEPGAGTTVCIYLPRHHGEHDVDAGAQDAGQLDHARAGETVLVVDDEPLVRMLVTEVLQELKYHAIEAVDGPSALKILQGPTHLDLLISDVGLPGGMNGRQVADAARQLRPDLKVLFITGYAENAVVGNGHLEPGMQVMTKPFRMEDLARRIGDMIGEQGAAA
jgi:PAS domain S-box-containing protein